MNDRQHFSRPYRKPYRKEEAHKEIKPMHYGKILLLILALLGVFFWINRPSVDDIKAKMNAQPFHSQMDQLAE